MAGRKKIYDQTKTISFRIHPSWEKDVKQLVKERLKELKAIYIAKREIDNNKSHKNDRKFPN